MRPFLDLPIKSKLMLVMTLTSVLALALACGGFLIFEIASDRRDLLRVLRVRAGIFADNSTAALAFNDPKAATETLATLKADPFMVSACIYSKEGQPFASFLRAGEKAGCPAQPEADGHRFTLHRLVMVQGIFFQGERIGTIYLEQDLRQIYRSVALFLAIALVVLLISSYAAFVLSARFQKLVSEPILDLARTAKDISRKGDYSARALRRSADELGVLVDGFNEMLGQIQARDNTLRETLSRYEATLESTADGILVVDNEGKIVSFNRRFVEMWKLPDDVLAIHDEDRALAFVLDQLKAPEAFLSRVRELYAQPQAESLEYVYFKDGRVFERYSHPQQMGEKILGRVWSFRDVTLRKRAEAELRKLTLELEQRVAERTAELSTLNKELESFSYSVSHDLRSPLRAIDGFSLALLRDLSGKLDPAQLDRLQRIRTAARRMGEIINDMLTLAHVARSEMRREQVDLSQLARGVAATLKESQPEREVAIEIDPGAQVQGDSHLLRIVVENLLSNAWKFTSKTPRARIEFKVLEQEGRPVYVVRDNGVGFDPAFSDRLFKPFVRLHSSAEFPGTGVGLATVSRIIGRHGGRVWAEGAPGKGAAVYFTL